MPNLIIFANSSWYIKNFRLSTCASLVNAGYDTLCVAGDDLYRKEIEATGAELVTVYLQATSTNPIKELRSLIEFFMVMRHFKPFCLLTFTPKSNFYGTACASIMSVPVISNISGLGEGAKTYTIIGAIKGLLYNFTLRRSYHVFFQNEVDLNTFIRRYKLDKKHISLLPGSGVNLSKFAPRSTTGDRFTFGFFSRIIPSKGIRLLIEAIKRLKKFDIPFEVKLAGPIDLNRTNPITSQEIESWEKNRYVEYCGELNDVISAIHECDCVILPSFYPEGTPKILIEAVACGKPIITTDTPGCRDLVKGNGILIEANNIDQLVNAMTKILMTDKNELASMGKISRQLAEDVYDEKFAINPYLTLLEKLRLIDEPAPKQ